MEIGSGVAWKGTVRTEKNPPSPSLWVGNVYDNYVLIMCQICTRNLLDHLTAHLDIGLLPETQCFP